MKSLRPFVSSCRRSLWSDDRSPASAIGVGRVLLRAIRFLLLVLILFVLVRLLVGCQTAGPLECRTSADLDLEKVLATSRLDGTVEAVWLICEVPLK